jgi:hypothetical protein
MAKEKRTCQNKDCGEEFEVNLDDPKAKKHRFCSPACSNAARGDSGGANSAGGKGSPKQGKQQQNNRCATPECSNTKGPNSPFCVVCQPDIRIRLEKVLVSGKSYDVVAVIVYNGKSVSGKLAWAIDGEGGWTEKDVDGSGEHLLIQPATKDRTLLVRLVSLVFLDGQQQPYDQPWTIDVVREILPATLSAPAATPPRVEVETHDVGTHWEVVVKTFTGPKPAPYAFEVRVPGLPVMRTVAESNPPVALTTNDAGMETVSIPFDPDHEREVVVRLVGQTADHTFTLPAHDVPYSDENPCPLEGPHEMTRMPRWLRGLLG